MITRALQDQQRRQREAFDHRYANGGTLLEKKTRRREDLAPGLKATNQNETAVYLKGQMDFRQQMLAIDNAESHQFKKAFDADTKKHYQEERDVVLR